MSKEVRDIEILDLLPSVFALVAVLGRVLWSNKTGGSPGYLFPWMVFGGAAATVITGLASVVTAKKRRTSIVLRIINTSLLLAAGLLFVWLLGFILTFRP